MNLQCYGYQHTRHNADFEKFNVDLPLVTRSTEFMLLITIPWEMWINGRWNDMDTLNGNMLDRRQALR
jgi:hypothetical protein